MLPSRPSSAGAGPRIGVVTAVNDLGPLVEVRSLRSGYSYGPARVAEALSARLSAPQAAGDHGTHAHDYGRPLQAGDEVLVCFLGDSRTDLVVVDRLLPVTTPSPVVVAALPAGAPLGP